MIDSEAFPRDQLLLMNLGQSFEESAKTADALRLAISVGRDVTESLPGQAMLLSMINSASRSFLGGVHVAGDLRTPCLVACSTESSLRDAATSLGARLEPATADTPVIAVGNVETPAVGVWINVRGAVAGVSTRFKGGYFDPSCFVPAAILSGALAIARVFRFLALHRRDALLLADASVDLLPGLGGEEIFAASVPTQLWVLGAGHLGQSFLWSLAAMHASLEAFDVAVQDMQDGGFANISTSLLTTSATLGKNKATFCSNWLNDRGAASRDVPEAFLPTTRVGAERTLVAGLHDLTTRMLLEMSGARAIFDVGIGGRSDNFMRFATHVFPGPLLAETAFVPAGNDADLAYQEYLIASPAYQALATTSEQACGLYNLASTAVGVSFVGLGVSAITLGLLASQTLGGTPYKVTGDLFSGNVFTACLWET